MLLTDDKLTTYQESPPIHPVRPIHQLPLCCILIIYVIM